jgi:hypothetical protein
MNLFSADNIKLYTQKKYTRRLHEAIVMGQYHEVEELVAGGALAHEQDAFGYIYSALHMALQHNQERCLQILLEHDSVDVNVFDNNGHTALTMATSLNRPYLKIFVDRGADVNLCRKRSTDNQKLPLHYAVEYSNVDNVKYLIKCGADINRPDALGKTPLITAAYYNRAIECAVTLLDAGCDAEVECQGATALKTAWAWNNYEMYGVLKDHFRDWTRRAHDLLRDSALALAPLALPPYVLMWILDWLPEFSRRSELKKITLLQNIYASRKRIKFAADAVERL